MARPTPPSIRLHANTPAPLWEAAQSALSRAELASVLSSVPAVVLVVDREQRIIAYSGCPPDAALEGRPLFDFVLKHHQPFYGEQLARVLDGGEAILFDVEGRGFEVESPESSAPWRKFTRVRLAPLAVGGDIQGVVAFAQDVDRELSLERRENRIRETLDHVGEGMLVVDLSTGAVLECNEAAARLFGIGPDELRDTTPVWLQVAPEGLPRLGWGALLDEMLEGRAVRGKAILREGEEVSVELRATSRKQDDGHFAFVLCRNIAADLAIERERANQERLATVGSLAAGVAHEINNPLAYVIANVQYALDAINQWQMREGESVADPERKRAQIKEALYEANEGARRVQRIVSDLKALARQGEDRVEPIDVENTLQWAIGVTMPEIRHRARLIKDLDPMPPVRGDEARLGQVFVNILLNAAQAIPPGHPQDNEIRIRTGTRNSRVFVEVLDTGSGIPEEHLRRIFDPFFTTKPRGVGTGLGLSICHEIVASMRGSLTGANRSKGGAKFTIELPAQLGTQPPPPPRPRLSTPPLKSARILVIDDEGLAAKALARILRDHRVEISDHAPTGLKLALENRFDVIFCDLMMPDLTGMAVHDAVSRECPSAARRMVFVTGGTFTEEARLFAARFANRCLFKPFDTVQVKNAISTVLSEQGEATGAEAC